MYRSDASGHTAPVPPQTNGGSSLDPEADALVRGLCEALERGDLDCLSDAKLETLLSSLIGLYGQKAEDRGAIFPLHPSAPASATAVLMATTGLLKGADLELFELGLWQSWSGMK